jgi:retron-type reverse transcriptase
VAEKKDEPVITWPELVAAGGIDAWVKAEMEKRAAKDPPTRRMFYRVAWRAYKTQHLSHVGTGVFHHDTPDIDKFDIPEREARREENQLPKIDDAQALAKILDLSIPRLRWLVYHREVDTGTHYRRWKIPKRDGGERLISAPKKDLKIAQKWIARYITEHLPVHGAAHGFLVGRSIKTNAIPHAGARVVVKVDLKDFYPTVTLPRVKGIFRKAGYGEQVATILALLATESPRIEQEIQGKKYWVATGPRSLPQGAPTSPSITNTLCLKLDARISGLATKYGLKYTRYADDLTFSAFGRELQLGKFLHRLKLILEAEGFRVHPKKTRIMRGGARQRVTGLIVNRAEGAPPARVPRETVRKLKAAIFNREHGKARPDESLAQLRGLASFVFMLDEERGAAFMQRIDKLAALEQGGSGE